MVNKLKKIDNDTSICISIAEKPGNFGANFHNTCYEKLNLNWVYLPRKIDSSLNLKKVINSIKTLNIKGCSVSMPHKEKVIEYLDNLDLSAQKIGAVNTIKISNDGLLKGFNTDYYGAKKAMQAHKIKGKKVLMVGCGGAAKAVGLAVKDLGGNLTVVNRTFERAKSLSKLLEVKLIKWDDIREFSGYLLINATSVGMNDINKMIVDDKVINKFNIIMDIVIYPSITKLIKTSNKLGKKTISGINMCVFQASEQFKIYTGIEAPNEIINKTISNIIS